MIREILLRTLPNVKMRNLHERVIDSRRPGDYTPPKNGQDATEMRAGFSILLALLSLSSFAQPQVQEHPKQLPGPYLIFGPVHTIRDERSKFSNLNGEWVEGERTVAMTASYNEDGTKQEKTVYVDGNIINRVEDSYSPDGRLLETRVFKGGKELESRTVNLYEGKEWVEEVTYRADDSVQRRTTFRRDDKQLKIETVEYDNDGRVIHQSSTNNDLQTRRARSITISPTRVFESESSTTVNTDGSREYRTEGSGGQFRRQVIASENPRQEDRVIYNKDGTIKEKVRILREFDSHQNMIKATWLSATGESAEFKPLWITYRTITYYEKN